MAPPWRISEWLNTPAPMDLEAKRGHVVVACAFQMLCPGCVSHAIPQLRAVHDLFAPLGAVVVGLHRARTDRCGTPTRCSSALLWLR